MDKNVNQYLAIDATKELNTYKTYRCAQSKMYYFLYCLQGKEAFSVLSGSFLKFNLSTSPIKSFFLCHVAVVVFPPVENQVKETTKTGKTAQQTLVEKTIFYIMMAAKL